MTERTEGPTSEALKAGDELRKRLDLILIATAMRTDLSAKARETLIISTKQRENALALDTFARETVEKERQKIAGWLDCPQDCRYANASGTCQRTDELCSHYVAECIRAGESP